MKPILSFLILMLFLVAGCGKRAVLPARIFARKALNGNRLLIGYRYTFNGRLFTDSATVANTVIGTDKITVIIDPEHPERSLPDIKN